MGNKTKKCPFCDKIVRDIRFKNLDFKLVEHIFSRHRSFVNNLVLNEIKKDKGVDE